MSYLHPITNYKNFLRSHAKQQGNSRIWIVEKEIPAFKKVKTYAADNERKFRYNPHSDLDALKANFLRHYSSQDYWTKADGIVNLVIPKGAKVHVDPNAHHSDLGKLRANVALCHSVVRQSDESQVAYGVSKHDSGFVYVNGMMTTGHRILVLPHVFDETDYTCAGGIHFFVDLNRALRY